MGLGIAIGYALGRSRPLHAAREWAHCKVLVGDDIGRVKSAAVIALLPETFVPLLWHRVRHGRYPQPPSKRRASVPAVVQHPHNPPSHADPALVSNHEDPRAAARDRAAIQEML